MIRIPQNPTLEQHMNTRKVLKVPDLTASAEIIEERTGLSDSPQRLTVKIWWSSPTVKLDRPSTFGICLRWTHRRLADRLKRAIDDQKVFVNPVVVPNISGNLYVQATCLVSGKRLNADLKKLGY